MNKDYDDGEFGTIPEPGTIELRRVLPAPIDRVWSYLTDPEKRGLWFAAGPMKLREGGRFTMTFRHSTLSHEKDAPERWKGAEGLTFSGRVTRCDPPRVLSYISDGEDDSEVAFELTPQGKDVLLVLTQRRIAKGTWMRDYAGGWHSHLDMLSDQLNNRTPRGFWTTVLRRHREYDELTKDAAGLES